MYSVTQSNLEDLFGPINVARWSNLSGANTADAVRITLAIQLASDRIDGFFRDGPYALPLSLNSGTAILTNWVATLAGVWLYRNRGQRDNDKVGDHYTAQEKATFAEMGQYKTATLARLNAATRMAPTPTAPTSI